MAAEFSFILEEGQRITKVMVRHGYIVDGIGFEITIDSEESNTQVLIASIRIHTNTNPDGYGPYGRAQATEDVKPFAAPLALDSTLVGFFGNYGNPYLTSIGAYAKYGRYGGV
ncbi:Mediator of RNA polymerase II transcription subunit 13 [Bienertia sinuspersici]